MASASRRPCLELQHAIITAKFGGPLRIVPGFGGVMARIESGGMATFEAVPMRVALPADSDTGRRELKASVGTVDGQLEQLFRAIGRSTASCFCVLREYDPALINADESVGGFIGQPEILELANSSYATAAVALTFSNVELINISIPRLFYTTANSPGLLS